MAWRIESAIKSAIISKVPPVGPSETGVPVVVVVAVEKCGAVSEVWPAAVVRTAVVPVHAPAIPSPPKPEKWGHSETNSEINAGASPPNSRHFNPARPRIYRIAVGIPRIVGGNIDFIIFRAGRLDGNVPMLVGHVDLVVAFEGLIFLGQPAHRLDGVHYVRLLIEVGVAEFGGPS